MSYAEVWVGHRVLPESFTPESDTYYIERHATLHHLVPFKTALTVLINVDHLNGFWRSPRARVDCFSSLPETSLW